MIAYNPDEESKDEGIIDEIMRETVKEILNTEEKPKENEDESIFPMKELQIPLKTTHDDSFIPDFSITLS